MTAPVTLTSPGLDRRHRLLVLAICSMSLLIVGLDTTIVNVALPSIHRSLNASVSGLQWTIDAYTLVIASLLMLSGSAADRIGANACSGSDWSYSRWGRACAPRRRVSTR